MLTGVRLFGVTSPARKRETPLSEMSPTSIQTNPHNIRLWPFCVFNLVLQALFCHLISIYGQNTVLVVLVVVLSRAALGATVVPTPARSPPTPFSAIRSFYGHRYNRGARHPWFSRCRSLDNMYSELISVSNRPSLGVAAWPQLSYFRSCDIPEEAEVSKVQIYGIHGCPEVCREGWSACRVGSSRWGAFLAYGQGTLLHRKTSTHNA